jgi:hypothetical protein
VQAGRRDGASGTTHAGGRRERPTGAEAHRRTRTRAGRACRRRGAGLADGAGRGGAAQGGACQAWGAGG